MADQYADDIVGGEVYIIVGDRRFEGMGDAKIQPRRREMTAGASSGGRLYGTEKAQPARAEISFVNHANADPLDVFDLRAHVDVTFVEKSRGIRHLFTKSLIEGTPEINLATGEVTGLRIATDQYSRNG